MPHVGRERHSTLTQEEAWPQADIRIMHSPFPIFVCVFEFLHVGRGRDLHLRQVGRSYYPLRKFWDVVSCFGHVRSINDFGNRLAQSKLFLPIFHTRFWSLRCSPFSPRAVIVVCIWLLLFGLEMGLILLEKPSVCRNLTNRARGLDFFFTPLE